MFEIIDWLSGLDPIFAFMLAMPFVVAIAGLLAEYWRHLRWHSDAEKATNHQQFVNESRPLVHGRDLRRIGG